MHILFYFILYFILYLKFLIYSRLKKSLDVICIKKGRMLANMLKTELFALMYILFYTLMVYSDILSHSTLSASFREVIPV